MKVFILFNFILLSLNCSSQTVTEITISHKKIVSATTFADLVSDIPKGCKVERCIISINTGGSLKEFSCIGDSLSKPFKAMLTKKQKGGFFFIEALISDCEKSHKPNYKVIIE